MTSSLPPTTPSFPGASHAMPSLSHKVKTHSPSRTGDVRCAPLRIGSPRACFVFPPRPLLTKTVVKARADGLPGMIVLPFATSDPVWPTVASASLTRVQGQLDSCIIIPSLRLCDTSRASDRRFSSVSPPCPSAAELRPRLTVQSNEFTVIGAALKRPCVAPAWVARRALGREQPFGACAAARSHRRITHVPCTRRSRTRTLPVSRSSLRPSL